MEIYYAILYKDKLGNKLCFDADGRFAVRNNEGKMVNPEETKSFNESKETCKAKEAFKEGVAQYVARGITGKSDVRYLTKKETKEIEKRERG